MLGQLRKLLGFDGNQTVKAQTPISPAFTANTGFSTPTQSQNQLQVGGQLPVQSVEGYYPQDNSVPFADPTDVGSYLQPSYNNPQTSLNGMFQQNTGYPMSQGVNQGGSNAADPTGWLRRQIRY